MKVGDKVKTEIGVGTILKLGREIAVLEMENGNFCKFLVAELEPIEEEKPEPDGIYLTPEKFKEITLELLDEGCPFSDNFSEKLGYMITSVIVYTELKKRLFGEETNENA